jgi:hypothetical protein
MCECCGRGTNEDDDKWLIGDRDERPRGVRWIIESGASAHMSAWKEAMGEHKTVALFEISFGDTAKLHIIG